MTKADTVHVIARGETVYSLSKRYGVSSEAIIESNSITDASEIKVGTKLLIPDSNISVSGKDVLYKVKPGDTYYSIAKRLELSLERLLALNGRNENHLLRIGEELVVDTSVRDAGLDEEKTFLVVADEVSQKLTRVPQWPVSGKKRILDGKLAGIGIETDPLSYVHAVAAGKVVWTGPYRGFGHVVLVDSRGYIYLYGGNERLFVNVGQTVEAGSRIGRLGLSDTDGVSHGEPVMFFAVFKDGNPIPPDEAPRG